MAITVINPALTGGSGTATLTITSATALNGMACFINQSGSLTAPTITGWTVYPTVHAQFNTSGSSIWYAYKIAAGGETSIAPTAGSGGTIVGICYWEINGMDASLTLDGTPVHVDNTASAATNSVAVSTSTAGSIVLIGVGVTANNTSCNTWTGSDVATNVSSGATRMQGGSYVTTGTLSSQTFTANWGTARVSGVLAVAIQPPSAGVTNNGAGFLGIL